MGLSGGGGFTEGRGNPLILTETGNYSILGNYNVYTTLRTYTVTKGSIGYTLMFVTWDYSRTTGAQPVNSRLNNGSEMGGVDSGKGYGFVSVQNGSTFVLQGKTGDSGNNDTCTITNVRVYCSDVNTSVVGS
jgi:hypothetical protein